MIFECGGGLRPSLVSIAAAMAQEEAKPEAACERCGAPAHHVIAGEPICENCWHEAGACCGGG